MSALGGRDSRGRRQHCCPRLAHRSARSRRAPPRRTGYISTGSIARSPPARISLRFANGGWIKSHPIPADRSYWGVDTLLEQQNQIFIRNLIESLRRRNGRPGRRSAKSPTSTRAAWMSAAIDAAGAAPLAPEFARIAAISTRRELPQAFAHLQSIGVEAPLSIGQMQDFADSARVIAVASQSGLGLPNRDYYLKERAEFQGGARRLHRAHRADAGAARGQRARRGRRIEGRDGARDAARAAPRCPTSNSAIRAQSIIR